MLLHRATLSRVGACGKELFLDACRVNLDSAHPRSFLSTVSVQFINVFFSGKAEIGNPPVNAVQWKKGHL